MLFAYNNKNYFPDDDPVLFGCNIYMPMGLFCTKELPTKSGGEREVVEKVSLLSGPQQERSPVSTPLELEHHIPLN